MTLLIQYMCHFVVLYRYNGQVIVTGNIFLGCTVIRCFTF